MKTLAVGDFKTHFSEVLNDVKHGEEFVVCYGRKKEKVAVLVPYEKYVKQPVTLGVLEGIASYKINDDFAMSDEDFLNS
ncbi:type II toxin-antitoxin system Phd/YefM family antitoxin [Pontiellaceae bacterium B1224]|nr:type II toxin-antitoxin system Phd/YefM family antitoxin [Pontiellaceae bacterium B1224]